MHPLFAFGSSSPVYTALWDVAYLSLKDAARLGQTCQAGNAWYKTISQELRDCANENRMDMRMFSCISPFDKDALATIRGAMQCAGFSFLYRKVQDEFKRHAVNQLMFAIACRTALPRRTELSIAYAQMFTRLNSQSLFREAMPLHATMAVRLLAFAMLLKRPGIRWASIRMVMMHVICAYYYRIVVTPAFVPAPLVDVIQRRLAFPPIHALRLANQYCDANEFPAGDDASTVLEWLRTTGHL